MLQKKEVKLTGVSPLIMHNGLLANPLNPVVQAMKKISGKRNKTEADFEELSKLEFNGGIYMGQNGDGPIIPAHVIEACIINGAKKSKDGMIAKAAVFVEENPPLLYDGPRDRDGLWADESFRFIVPVNVQRSKVMRTRPIFHDWSLEFTITYDDSQTDAAKIMMWLEAAGTQVGLCDWRPRYGRFVVED